MCAAYFVLQEEILIISNSRLNKTGKLYSGISTFPSDSPDFSPINWILKPDIIQINLLKFKNTLKF